MLIIIMDIQVHKCTTEQSYIENETITEIYSDKELQGIKFFMCDEVKFKR